MPINFTEIPIDNKDGGLSDTFELFARDFLEILGYTIVEDPGRGPDGGKDLIVSETLNGLDGPYEEIKWLVSCKHYSNSGSSVSNNVEIDITDRIKSFGCDGFIGFYSTIASQALLNKLNDLKIKFLVFDQKKIEGHIVGNEKMNLIFTRYFPQSFKSWKELDNGYEPTMLFDYYIQKELLGSIFTFIFKSSFYLMKLIQNSDSVEVLFQNEDIRIEKVEGLYSILMDDYMINNYKNRQDQLVKINFKKILYDNYNIELDSEFIGISYILGSGSNLMLVFKQLIIVDEMRYIELKSDFEKMKSIL